jgi:hypothetical protein
MSLAEIHKKAKLVMIPSGFKADELLYSVLPNDGSGNFTASGDTDSTRVNKDGLIEKVTSLVPRLNYDFGNPKNPHLLLESQRTNLLTKSEQPANWTYTEFGSGSAGTITTGKLDVMGGTNAAQIDFPSDADNVSINFGQSTSSVASGSVAVSVYIKLVESGSKILQFRCSTGVQTNVTVNTTDFVRYEVTGTRNSNESFGIKLRPSASTSSGGFSIIICQPQEETGTFATSYIPTTGSEATRSQDTCTGGGSSSIFNDSEGTLFLEISRPINDSTTRSISISDGSSSDRVIIQYISGFILGIVASNTSSLQTFVFSTTSTSLNKIAIRYKKNDFAMYVNGTQAGTDTSGNAPIGLSSFDFNDGTGSQKYEGQCAQAMYFDTALTNAELTTLTT